MMTYSRSMWRLIDRVCSPRMDVLRHRVAVLFWSAGIVGLVALGLGACAPAPAVTSDVAAAEIALTDLERLAQTYRRSSFADPAVVAKIQAADRKAYAAVKAAESNPVLLSIAWSAIGEMTAAVPK